MVLCNINNKRPSSKGRDAIFHFITRPPYGERSTTVYFVCISLVYEINRKARATIYYTNSVRVQILDDFIYFFLRTWRKAKKELSHIGYLIEYLRLQLTELIYVDPEVMLSTALCSTWKVCVFLRPIYAILYFPI